MKKLTIKQKQDENFQTFKIHLNTNKMENLENHYSELLSDGCYIWHGQCCGDGQVEYNLYDRDGNHIGYVIMSNGTRYGEEAGSIHEINI